jgi:hypothetical protein
MLVLQFEREKGFSNMKSENNNKVKMEKEEGDIISEEKVGKTLKRALRCYSTLQTEDGFWPGDYGGPLFLLPSLVCIKYHCPLFLVYNTMS